MSDSPQVIDQTIRDELLDISQSFIVQAPAGSGKTELLTQRVLALLAVVKKPENILAITFTRKAAAEMRERVIGALRLAQRPAPKSEHELTRYNLAKKVLQVDQLKNWNLLANPNRLNLLTIDSLAASLSGALPLLSQTGTLPNIEENAYLYYMAAAERMLQEVDNDDDLAKNIRTLLIHKDNNLKQVTELIAELLSKRLQWLGKTNLSGDGPNAEYEYSCGNIFNSLEIIIEEKLQEVYQAMPKDIISELPNLLRQASNVLRAEHKNTVVNLATNNRFDAINVPTSADLQLWLAISEMLLKANKNQANFFSSPNKNIGFPTNKDAKDENEVEQFERNKSKLKTILSDLSNSPHNTKIAQLLNQIRYLPTDIETEIENPVLQAVTELLPVAASYLKWIFKENNIIDFTELSIASLEALGCEGAPTDFALALDYRIEHILLDEFQDTSSPQIRLIELLTAGWDASQSKSLFLVGDPMQSIYRFRDANVSLFLQVIESGLGQLKPIFRQLAVNFRSSKTVIDWVNQQFSMIMPEQSDLTLSAVSYSCSTAFHASFDQSRVEVCVTIDAEDYKTEARQVVELVESHLLENTDLQKQSINDGNREPYEAKTLAILVRSRSHLIDIIDLLNRKSISFQALDLESLANKIIVSDITSMALALTDIYDQLSWVACLRSPWYSLGLNDIRLIVARVASTGLDFPTVINELLLEVPNPELLSVRGKKRACVIQPILDHAIAQKGKKPFMKWLSGCFDAVGGRLQIDTLSEHEDLDTCIEAISKIEQGGEIIDRRKLQQALEKLYASPNPKADAQVQLMTIHKSKGLEFDTVIIPRADAWRTRPDYPLLKWTEVLDKQGVSHNLLAVSKQTGKENDSIYQYISYIEKQKAKYEAQRLLYVASTRAKSKLVLFGDICVNRAKSSDEQTVYKKPSGTSFLAMLWEGVEQNLNFVVGANISDKTKVTVIPQKLNESELAELTALDTTEKQLKHIFPARKFKRTYLKYIEKAPANTKITSNQERYLDQSNKSLEVEQYQDLAATVIGRVVHRQLEWLTSQFVDSSVSPQDFLLPTNWVEITKSQLLEMGYTLDAAHIDTAIELVIRAVRNTLEDKTGQFILSEHVQAESEIELMIVGKNGDYQTKIIDRTFIFEGQRWIVDYKTSEPNKNEKLEDFLHKEKINYQQQIQGYISLYDGANAIPTIAGLYFPLIKHFERY